jgi:hypothetical protein
LCTHSSNLLRIFSKTLLQSALSLFAIEYCFLTQRCWQVDFCRRQFCYIPTKKSQGLRSGDLAGHTMSPNLEINFPGNNARTSCNMLSKKPSIISQYLSELTVIAAAVRYEKNKALLRILLKSHTKQSLFHYATASHAFLIYCATCFSKSCYPALNQLS